MSSENCGSDIVNFYKDQTIFLTGGTGFVGKVLVEKLLRVCEIKKIHLMVRPKKGKTTQERLKDIFELPCFDSLRNRNVNFTEKVSLIEGDCEQTNMGLSEATVSILRTEVNIMIHAAANVKFDQSLRVAAYNARSVRDALNLAKGMPHLKAFVYVSTAYANCIHSFIGERFYEPPIKPDELFELVNRLDDEKLEKITPRLLDQYPNTYVYAKAVAEHIVQMESSGLPITMVRPAIIISSVNEPVPGWIDNYYGPIGIVMAASLGVLRSLHCEPDATANLVACDFVANSILSSAWFTTTKLVQETTSVPIYNYVGNNLDMTWRRFMGLIEQNAWDYPTVKIVWYYCFKLRSNYYWHKFCIFFMHTVVAYVVDFFLFITGNQTLAVSNYRRLDKMMSLISYFSTQSWIFDIRNVDNMWANMSQIDRTLFNFDGNSVDLVEFTKDSIKGGKRFLLKETGGVLPAAKLKLKRLMVAHYSLLAVLYLFVYWLVRKFVF